MSAFIKEIFTGLWSLITGLRITAKEFITPKVTVHYPHESEKMPARFRGHVELIAGEDGSPNCVSCMMCERACPSGCIKITAHKDPETKKKVLTGWDLDFTKCSLCGSCVESCKFDALRFSRVYNHVSQNKDDFQYDLLKDLEEENK